jgi:hypothetical protein
VRGYLTLEAVSRLLADGAQNGHAGVPAAEDAR